MIITLNESTLLINPSHKRCFIFTIPFFMSRRSYKEPINFENALKTQVLFVELLVGTLGEFFPGFQGQGGSFTCVLPRPMVLRIIKDNSVTKESWFQTVRLYAPLSIAFFLSMGKISTFSNS